MIGFAVHRSRVLLTSVELRMVSGEAAIGPDGPEPAVEGAGGAEAGQS
jgi:hypothetical protein